MIKILKLIYRKHNYHKIFQSLYQLEANPITKKLKITKHIEQIKAHQKKSNKPLKTY